MEDEVVVAWQLGRSVKPHRRVAVRCPFGFPAVTEQPAFDPDGRPFPTTFYLTCPWLVSAIARIEAAGGVERWSVAATTDPELHDSLVRADRDQKRIRPDFDVGIAGTRDRDHLKCLHAHAAFALARPPYELGERIVAEVDDRWCPDGRCAKALES